MSSRDGAAFGYQLRATDEGWAWVTFDLAGQEQERGHAPNKAVAAACVIRALARGACDEAAEMRSAA